MDLEIALKFVNDILVTQAGRDLRPPEVSVFEGTWQGMTYEQMADSSPYSANYLMRDIAPKFWRLLSEILGESVGKTNLRIVINKNYGSIQKSSEQLSSKTRIDRKGVARRLNWGNAPIIPSHFYGRDRELKTLQTWIVQDRCQLLGLWGLSGTGKTLLMKKLAEEIQEQYRVLIWRSLIPGLPLWETVKEILYSGFGIVEKNQNKLLPRLLEQLRTHPCLILLDGMAGILQSRALSGNYLAGYENYGEFFRVVGESSHQSCVVVTSLENPLRIMPPSSNESAIRYLKLSGLTLEEANSLLMREAITGVEEANTLIDYYQGNPAILTMVAHIIRELFSGNVAEFLAQKSLVFGEINQLLSKSFDRLSVLEKEILYWLISEVQPMSLPEIQEALPFSIYPVELIEALESLNQRSLIEINQVARRSVFVLSPMIREFVTNQFMAQIGKKFSIANRQNSLLTENTIELGTKKQKTTHLSQWLENRFELGWQPIEVLFAASARSPARLRSAFNFRGDGVITRFKQVDLDGDNSLTVLLLLAIEQEESAIKVCVQAQPAPPQQILPEHLQLNLIDSNGSVLAQIKSEAQDNFIQLPYFRGTATEKFTISIDNLNSASYEEDFTI